MRVEEKEVLFDGLALGKSGQNHKDDPGVYLPSLLLHLLLLLQQVPQIRLLGQLNIILQDTLLDLVLNYLLPLHTALQFPQHLVKSLRREPERGAEQYPSRRCSSPG